MGGVFNAVTSVIESVVDPVMDVVSNVADPVFETASSVVEPTFEVVNKAMDYVAPIGFSLMMGNALAGAMPSPGSIATGGEMLSAEQVASLSQYPDAFQAYQAAGMVPSGLTPVTATSLISQTPVTQYPGMLTDAAISGLAGGPGAAATAIPSLAAPSITEGALTAAGLGATGASALYPSLTNLANSGTGTGATSGLSVSDLANLPTNVLQSISDATGIPTGMLSTLGSSALSGLGSYLQQQSATEAAQASANAQIEAARIAAEAAKFRPVGVTTRFGQSQFGYNPVTGNLESAGYTLSPEAKAQQDALMGVSNQALQQYQGAMGAAAPIGAAASGLFGLGQGYLGTTPQEQAAKYMAEQQALLAPSREREMAALENRLLQQGRLGLATGGTSTLGAANPELEAYYNAKRMQDLQLAAQATQGGMDYTKFGAGLMGTGGDLLKQMYGTQTAAYAPYQTALGGATALESLGQQPMNIGAELGSSASAAAAAAGRQQAQGMLGAAQTMQPYNAYSPWGALLTGAGNTVQNYQTQQQQQQLQNQLLSSIWGV